jgi:hypothetical protein
LPIPAEKEEPRDGEGFAKNNGRTSIQFAASVILEKATEQSQNGPDAED